MVNHNSLARASGMLVHSHKWRKILQAAAFGLYIFPLIILVPIYLSIQEDYNTYTPMSLSSYNTRYNKPLSITVTMFTEGLATMVDMAVLKRVFSNKQNLAMQGVVDARRQSTTSSKSSRRGITHLSTDIIVHYLITWFILAADIILKVVIAFGLVASFDNSVSLATLAMRARINIMYGKELKRIVEGQADEQKKDEEERGSEKWPEVKLEVFSRVAFSTFESEAVAEREAASIDKS